MEGQGAESPSFSQAPYPLTCAAFMKALDLKSSCTRGTWHPLLRCSLEQRTLCLHSIGNKHSSWEQLTSLFKGWLLKSSTQQRKAICHTKITPQLPGGKRAACRVPTPLTASSCTVLMSATSNQHVFSPKQVPCQTR